MADAGRARRILVRTGLVVVSLALALVAVWSLAIGPVAVWRVLSHGTTTVWDHEAYPGRTLGPSTSPQPWPRGEMDLPAVVVTELGELTLEEVLVETGTLSFVIVSDGQLVYEWYRPGHDPGRPVMLFSATKSLLSLMIGAAIEDGIIGGVDTAIADVMTDMEALDDTRIEDLLTMGSGLGYVENDNPFGVHVEFNYTPDLTEAIRRLESGEAAGFRYKSGDYAVLGLVLNDSLSGEDLTAYLGRRIWDRLGATGTAVWSTDDTDGLERTWCCLAMTAPDLARFGQMILDEGRWGESEVVPGDWVARSLTPAYDVWPEEYEESPLVNYGYGWWLTDAGGWLALGKDGQYLYVDQTRRLVMVRQGEETGDVSWVGLFSELVAG